MSKRTVVLIILDGWGIGRNDPTNPIYIAKPKTIDFIKSHYLAGSLQASGIAVGLPWGEEGNSEVGHLTLGAGKIVYQHYPRITLAIRNGNFFKNEALLGAFSHVSQNSSALNLVGILSEGNVHASIAHINTLIEFAKQSKIERINLHFFADGKDSPPKSVLNLLKKINLLEKNDPAVRLASLSGRFYALDRDRHWDRTQKTYEILLGRGPVTENLKEYVEYHYKRELIDEYIEPTLVGTEIHAIKDNDAVLFFDFREDSIRQIVSPFALADFKEFTRLPLKNIYLATMTQYSDKFASHVLFPPEKIEKPLGVVLADNNKLQLRIAETQKYAHVTYFFNGLKDAPAKNEYRLLVPSRNILHQDEHPEMMAAEVANRIVQALEEGEMDFILANFANSDVIAHTGNFEAAVKAVQVLDTEIEKVMRAALARNASLIITADHGNLERMIDPLTGIPETKHDPSPVPIYLVGKEFEKQKDAATISHIENETIGILSDVAPTALELLGIKKPPEMSGVSLLGSLR